MKRRLCATEHQEQVTVIKWAQLMSARVPELALLLHVPNGGSRHKIEAARLKAAGVKRGVPDLLLPVPWSGYHGLWIEMKAQGGRTTPEQKQWIEALHYHGYKALVCQGANEAIDAIMEYLAVT